MILSASSVLTAYLIGSVSSTCIVGRLAGGVDMRNEPDGRVSAAAVYEKIGLRSFLAVVLLDISLSMLAVFLAQVLTGSLIVSMLAGIAVVAGHNWSIFIKLKGGLGATTILGVLIMMTSWTVIIGLIASGVVLCLTRRPGISTAYGILAISGYLYIQNGLGTLAIYPFMLFSLMLLKRFQVYQSPKLRIWNRFNVNW